MEILDNLPPSIGLVLGLLLIVWLVLALLVPFMIESIRTSSRRSLTELEEINDKMDRLVALLERQQTPRALPAELANPIATGRRAAEEEEEEEEENEDSEDYGPPASAPARESVSNVRRRKEPTI
jgi:hypothetical protein